MDFKIMTLTIIMTDVTDIHSGNDLLQDTQSVKDKAGLRTRELSLMSIIS